MTTSKYLSIESLPGKLLVNVRGQWIFDEVLALEDAVASIVGRYFAMDRDKRWDRVQRAYDLLTAGVGAVHPTSAEATRRPSGTS